MKKLILTLLFLLTPNILFAQIINFPIKKASKIFLLDGRSVELGVTNLDSDNDSQDVTIESNRVSIGVLQSDMDSAEAAIQNILADNDSQDVTIEANKVGVASLEVGLQTHQNNPTGAHAGAENYAVEKPANQDFSTTF